MKKIISLIALWIATTSLCWAQETDDYDVRIRPVLGYAKFNGSFLVGDTQGAPTRLKSEDVVVGFAAAVSHEWRNWRGELEYAWRYRTDLNGYVYFNDRDLRIRSNVENQTLAANLFRYFGSNDRLQMYAMAGLGVVQNRSHADISDTSATSYSEELERSELHLMWNVGLGATLDISKRWSIDAGYRYVSLGRATTPTFSNGFSLSTGDLSSHDVALTLRRNFD